MSNMVIPRLPTEIMDKIFLMVDFDTLQKCRAIQSPYIKICTQYKNIFEAVENDNIKNIKWLISYKICDLAYQTELYSGLDFKNFHRSSKKIQNLQNELFWLQQFLDIHHWLFFDCQELIFLIVCASGNLNLVKWLKQQEDYKNRTFEKCFMIIFALGYVEILEWICANGCSIPSNIFAMIGYFVKPCDHDALTWLLTMRQPTERDKYNCMINVVHKNYYDANTDDLLADGQLLQKYGLVNDNYEQILCDEWHNEHFGFA